MSKILEVVADSMQSAINAQKGGADRIELCDALVIGGVTPSAGKIKMCIEQLNLPIYVMIRPRGADFLYSNTDFELMLQNIELAKELGAHGIVAGILKEDGGFHWKRMEAIVKASGPLPVTCHKAFDRCLNAQDALEGLIDIGVKRVLTSGQQRTLREGYGVVKDLVAQANGRIEIIAGGGLNTEVIDDLLKIEGLNEFHGAMRSNVRSKMNFLGHMTNTEKSIKHEFEWTEAGVEETRILADRIHYAV